MIEFRAAAEVCLILTIVGLEAFSANLIEFALDGGDGRVVRNGQDLSVAEVRDLSLNERYSEILPGLLSRPSPTSETWWPTFRRTQKLASLVRHAIYEPTSRVGGGNVSLLQHLYDRRYGGAPEMMLSAFDHFYPGYVKTERLEQLEKLVQQR